MDEPPSDHDTRSADTARRRRLPRPSHATLALALFAILAPAAVFSLYLASDDSGVRANAQSVETPALDLDALESRLATLEAAPAPADSVLTNLEDRVSAVERAATDAQALDNEHTRIDTNLAVRLQELDRRIDRLVARDDVILETVEVVVSLNYTRRTREQYIADASVNGFFSPWSCGEVFDIFGRPDSFTVANDNTPLLCRLNQQFIR